MHRREIDTLDLVERTARAAGVHLLTDQQFVALADARRFIEAAAALGYTVLGYEGFRIGDGYTRPDMEAIVDLSGCDRSESASAAVAVLQRFDDDALVFDFVLRAE